MRVPPDHPHEVMSDRGLSLLELVAAMAIFAMVSLIGLQTISGGIRARDILTTRESSTADLVGAITLLRGDLRAAIEIPFTSPDGEQRAAFMASGNEGWMEFSIAAAHSLPSEKGGGVQRVIWRWDTASGQLLRQSWQALNPNGPDARGPEVTILAGVQDWVLRMYTTDDGWIAPDTMNDDPEALSRPEGVELVLTQEDFGDIRVVVAFK